MLALYRLASRWPLWLLHGVGALMGWAAWLVSPTYRRRFAEHAALAGYGFAQVRPAIAHAGRMALETPRLWFGPPVPVQWNGAELADAAYATGQGVVFLSPHLGCFEMTAQGVAARYHAAQGPVTVLYRPARQPALARVVEMARQREGLHTAPATLAGVRQMLKALRAGHTVGLLPDQVPPEGLGQWTPFFGRDAYTMTLAARLVQQTGAVLLLIWGERLPRGRGYVLHLREPSAPLPADLPQAVAQINREMERLIRECPQQYLWGYGRYKTPRGEL
jgi:KDO2-lipid IV(A) lauroyltransferase